MTNELPPQILRALLREQLDNKQYWEDSMMQQFRKQFWEPMDADLNLVADELISTSTFLDGIVDFFKSVQSF